MRFVASTEDVARDGLVIEAAGWQLDNYRNNPVVLWSHDYWGRTLPIGRAEVSVEGTRLMADVTFDVDDPFAVQIKRKYERKFLNAVSVGWDTKEFAPSPDGKTAPRITKAELLDISAVPVPGDPGALKERQLAGARSLHDELARLLAEAPSEPQETREPEGTPNPSPEPESRAGAVLSGRNRERLSQAASLISEVLSEAEKKSEEKSTESESTEPRGEEADPLAFLDELSARLDRALTGR